MTLLRGESKTPIFTPRETSLSDIWRHISSHVIFIKKCSVLMFFSIKFPIEWAINELSTIILKFLRRIKFNFFYRRKGTFNFDLPLKAQILKHFKSIVENSSIAHSMGNFILKNIKTEHFWWKWRVTRYDVICHIMTFP